MVDTENEFDSNGHCPDTDITGRTSQRSKYNEEKTDDRVFGTCVRLSSCWHHLIKDIRSGTIWTSGGVTWSYGPMAGLPLSSLCHLIGGYLVNFLSSTIFIKTMMELWKYPSFWPTKNIRKYMRGQMMPSLGVKLCTSTREKSD